MEAVRLGGPRWRRIPTHLRVQDRNEAAHWRRRGGRGDNLTLGRGGGASFIQEFTSLYQKISHLQKASHVTNYRSSSHQTPTNRMC